MGEGSEVTGRLETVGASRRTFLYGSALAVATVTLGACAPNESKGSAQPDGKASPDVTTGKGSATKPLPVPKTLREAPALTAMVKRGELPPLAERLPEHPYVVPHEWVRRGTYGGQLLMIMDSTTSAAIKEYCYGHSLLRFLNDGRDVGPGLAESWESNADASVWTFRFRKGLRWSDGHSWTTADIMYWWEDMVLDEVHPEVPPDDVRSGRDTVATVTAPDDHTLVLTFDAPAPATPDRIAAWVNAGVGPRWMVPRHYLRQFHPRYNKKVTKRSWYEEHDRKSDWTANPDCPTMAGWRLKAYAEGRSVRLERNPFYYAVTRHGDQLPYLDEIRINAVRDAQVRRLQLTEGKVDYVHGAHVPLTLADISGLKQAEKRTGVRLWLWDSGSGTGSITFFNYDYPDAGLRELIRDKRFRQALSHAFDRKDARKAIYFNTGEITTGTLSPKGVTFQVNEQGQRLFEQWRDAYLGYDPERAKALLDELGVVDRNGDGKRELPDGSPLALSLDYPADTSNEHIQKCTYLKRDWEAIGITTRINPVAPDAFSDLWSQGRLMTTTAWEVGDNQPLVYPGWVIPVQPEHWAPLHGQAFILQTGDPSKLKAQEKVDPWKRQPPWLLPDKGDPIDRLWKLYARARVAVDEMERIKLLWEIFKVHIEDGPFFLGVVANYPQVVLAREGLGNVPQRENLALGGWVNTWILPSPAVYDPETYFWSNPEEHPV
ncbi:ABC transporter substrate-binding protein [Actinopolymorpha alba]|uniref:ABC transporter substrate-binding protein n=1 Tax=Actinopolymorpha alba TaxID=533267 RepID=UPI000363300B|nr:ABC transporter substrate-binding protein [Actinopolymorpha alba]